MHLTVYAGGMTSVFKTLSGACSWLLEYASLSGRTKPPLVTLVCLKDTNVFILAVTLDVLTTANATGVLLPTVRIIKANYKSSL
jgi:hypothetical protein